MARRMRLENDAPERRGPPREELLPTLERARETHVEVRSRGLFGWGGTDLLSGRPDTETRVVALVVRALVHTRASLDADDDVGRLALERLRTGPEGRKGARFEAGTWRELVSTEPHAQRRCSSCAYSGGQQVCIACDGTGKIVIQRGRNTKYIACNGCDGRGRLVCSRCDGTRVTYAVTTRTTQDHVEELEHVFAPLLVPPLHEAVAELLLGQEELPTELRLDLERPGTDASASYRTAPSDGPPRAFGVDISLALSEARRAVERMAAGRTVVDQAVETHAVPLSVLQYGKTHVALANLTGERVVAVRADED